MLLCQNLGRSHQRRHITVPEHHKAGGGSDHRLTGADVSLYQPVHRRGLLQVGADLVDGALLGAGERKRNLLQKRSDVGVFAQKGGLGIAVGAHRMQRKRQHQQLLKDKPAAGDFGALAVGGQMDIFERKVQVAQLVLPAQKSRQRVRQIFVEQTQRLLDILGDHLGGKSLCQRIDRQKRGGQVGGIDGRRVHLLFGGRSTHLAIEQIFLVVLECIDGVLCVKEGNHHRAAVVGDLDLGDGQSLADILRRGLCHYPCAHCADLPRRRIGDKGRLGEVDIGAREVIEQVADGMDVDFLIEGGALGADTSEILDIGVQIESQKDDLL